MRTVLCSTTAGRGVLLLALVAGIGGSTLAPPASAADTVSAGGARQVAGPHPAHGSATGTGRRASAAGAHLGPAVKYVRLADGTVREVR